MKPLPRSTKILLAILVFVMMAALSAAMTRVWMDGIEPVRGPIVDIADPEDTLTGKEDLIRLERPSPNAVVSSPLRVEGMARGHWYFEAEFPVVLIDANGDEVVTHYATAEGEWMTEDFVPFSSTLVFDPPATATGKLVLMKANASGLPEHDDQVVVRVRFGDTESGDTENGATEDPAVDEPKAGEEPSRSGSCFRTGCSGQVCADEEVVTTCEFRPEYACFDDARCERQPNGNCGWTPTLALQACLQDTGIGAGSELGR